MKKLLIAVVLGLVLVLALATTALADNGPHGGFSANTDACASCHSIHRAQNPSGVLLISGTDEEQFCTNCHGGTGAYTDVRDGTYGAGTEGTTGGCLFGGGFENTACQHTYTGKAFYNEHLAVPSDPVQSGHTLGVVGTIWGAGNYSGTNASTTTLECSSCHDPHGNAGKAVGGAAMASYRLLRYNVGNGYEAATTSTYFASTSTGVTNIVSGAGTTGGVTVKDTATKWYTVNSATDPLTGLPLDTSMAALSLSASRGNRVLSYGPNDPFSPTRGSTYRRPAYTANASTVSCEFVPTVGTGAIVYDYAFDATPAGSNCAANATVAGPLFNNYEQRVGITMFCSQCHDRYLATGTGGDWVNSQPGETIYKYRHSSGAAAADGSSWACVDCHFAHGTSATATTALDTSDPVALPNGAAGASLANDSALLKIDNRGLCIRCHGTSAAHFLFSPVVP